jgi:hypothetical protein
MAIIIIRECHPHRMIINDRPELPARCLLLRRAPTQPADHLLSPALLKYHSIGASKILFKYFKYLV